MNARKIGRATCVLFTTCVALALTPTVAHAQAGERVRYSIQAQDLGTALTELARQSKREIYFSSDLTRGIRASSVSGQLTVEQALDQLLRGTGLAYRLNSTGAIVIEKNAVREGQVAGAAAPETERADDRAIVVTGTNIRSAVNSTVPVISFNRKDIENSGQGTTQEFLARLPQNFQGGGTEGASETGFFSGGNLRFVNAGFQSGVNLRGLGSRATLTLINGRRLAPADQGLITGDISMIPLSAVERIEVLTDGASAIYGADAVAGVVNVILRRTFKGQESRARYGFSTEGGVDEYRLGHAGGHSWNTGSFFLAGEYYDRTRLREADRPGLTQPPLGRADFLPDVERASMVGHFEQELTPGLKVFADGIYSHSDTNFFEGISAFNQANEYNNKSSQYSLTGGFEGALENGWTVVLSGLSAKSSLDSDVDLFGLAGSIIQTVTSSTDEHFNSVDFLARGNLLELPAGNLALAFGASHAWSDFDQDGLISSATFNLLIHRVTTRRVASAFGEILAPLIGKDMRVPLVNRLEVSLAGRYDHYSDFGGTFNPKVGIAWSPFSDLLLRASYSTSFRAPNSFERVRENNGIPTLSIRAFTRPGGGGTIPILLVGGSKELGPETSDNYSVGGTYNPSFLRGLSLGLNWFNIRYKDRIDAAPFSSNALNRPELAPFVIDFSAPGSARAFAEAFIAQGAVLNNFVPGSSLDTVTFGYDIRTQNLAIVEIAGLDFNVAYEFELGRNRFGLRADVAYIDKIETQATKSSPVFDRVDTLGQPVDWRGRGTVSWSNGPFSATAAVNYVDSYKDETGASVLKVDSLTTVDLSAAVDIGEATKVRAFDGLSARLSASNLFNADPPFANNALARARFDQAYYDIRRRFVAFELIKRW